MLNLYLVIVAPTLEELAAMQKAGTSGLQRLESVS